MMSVLMSAVIDFEKVMQSREAIVYVLHQACPLHEGISASPPSPTHPSRTPLSLHPTGLSLLRDDIGEGIRNN